MIKEIRSVYISELEVNTDHVNDKGVKEMKVCTITCHNCYNYGATLQAYALQQYFIKNRCKCWVIDYVPWYMEYNVRYKRIPEKWNKSIFRKLLYCGTHHPQIASKWKRKYRFDSFSRKYLNTTIRYRDINELSKNPPEADMYVCGSDQIWNGIDYNNGKDPAFYLAFIDQKSKYKISYAASFGRNCVYDNFWKDNSSYLSKFSGISVRESNGVDILNDFGLSAQCVIDPVFLLDSNSWELMLRDKRRKEKYILIYSLDDSNVPEELVRRYRDSYRIISIGEIKIPNTEYDRNCGPQEFLEYIHDAEYIITNSFHCVAFSLIFKKTFTIFDRKVGTNSRISNLLNLAEIDNIAYENDLEKEIDFKTVFNNIRMHIN